MTQIADIGDCAAYVAVHVELVGHSELPPERTSAELKTSSAGLPPTIEPVRALPPNVHVTLPKIEGHVNDTCGVTGIDREPLKPLVHEADPGCGSVPATTVPVLLQPDGFVLVQLVNVRPSMLPVTVVPAPPPALVVVSIVVDAAHVIVGLTVPPDVVKTAV